MNTSTPRLPIEHTIKCIPPYFDHIESGLKTFELRRNDRDYQVGDTLRLVEYRPDWNNYTGRELRRRVTYVLHVGKFVPGADYVCMSLGVP